MFVNLKLDKIFLSILILFIVNTAIAVSADPIAMGDAFGKAVEAGRMAHIAGLGAVRRNAEATSPLTSFLS